jgi:hypothetical protein
LSAEPHESVKKPFENSAISAEGALKKVAERETSGSKSSKIAAR